MIISVDHVMPLSSIRALLPLPALAQCASALLCEYCACVFVHRSTLYRVHWWSIPRHKLVALCLVPQLLIDINNYFALVFAEARRQALLPIVAAEFSQPRRATSLL